MMMGTHPRVIMVSAGFWPAIGGAERQALELSRELRARGVGVCVLTRRLGCAVAREAIHGVPVRRLPVIGTGALDSISFLIGALGWLLKHADEYDAIHAHLAGSPALAAALAGRFLGKPVIVKLGGGRGLGELSSRSSVGRLKLRLLALLKPCFLAVASDLVIEAREYLGAGVSIEVLPNGVDAGRFKPVSPKEKLALRASLGWSGTVFLYTGRLSWEKRLPWFAKLWDEATRGCDATLVLIGAGPEQAPLDALLAGGMSRVRILPPVEDTAPFYAAADAFVLPSVSEGLSNSLLEAMASGLAIVASAVGGTAEAIENGSTGLLFSRDNEKEVAACVRRVYDGPEAAAELGAAARRVCAERYALSRIAARLEELYRGRA